MVANVTQMLVEEHRLILRMIALVEQNTKRMEEGRFRDWQFFLDAVDFIRNYADRFHHAKEEEVLFVALVENGMPAKNSPIEAMQLEHDQGRALVRSLEEAASLALAGASGHIPAIAAGAKGYAALLRGHIDKEDTILYPLAERLLPAEVRQSLLAAYARAEAERPQLEEKYHQLVKNYEQQTAD
ncbi:MAG: cation-binding protein [Deltaproteobacteria bacterium]|nr:cation-binding protein [Deltaproteobacteria bacterium]NCP78239.1 cation-binding protein [Desulfuromonadales bacterium]